MMLTIFNGPVMSLTISVYRPLVHEQKFAVHCVSRDELYGPRMGLPRRQYGRRYRRLDPANRYQAGQIASLAVGLTLLLLEADLRGRPGLQVTRALNHAILPI